MQRIVNEFLDSGNEFLSQIDDAELSELKRVAALSLAPLEKRAKIDAIGIMITKMYKKRNE